MNKYQKALETLMNSNIKLCVYKDVDLEQQPSLFDLYHSELFTLQELVEKAIPKKVKTTGHHLKCPRCDNIFFDKSIGYCSCCAQKIDWTKENEE